MTKLTRQKQVAEIIKCGKDPVYFFNKVSSSESYNSENIRNLPKKDKKINVAFQLSNGEKYPINAKRVWPFACSKEVL